MMAQLKVPPDLQSCCSKDTPPLLACILSYHHEELDLVDIMTYSNHLMDNKMIDNFSKYDLSTRGITDKREQDKTIESLKQEEQSQLSISYFQREQKVFNLQRINFKGLRESINYKVDINYIHELDLQKQIDSCDDTMIENFLASYCGKNFKSITLLSRDFMIKLVNGYGVESNNLISKSSCRCVKVRSQSSKPVQECKCKLGKRYLLLNACMYMTSGDQLDKEDKKFLEKSEDLFDLKVKECSKIMENIMRGIEILLLSPSCDFFTIRSVVELSS
ncbi:unnamed protein product [Moneuplotes crassus]|uniref:Uncharacterized protein n=1 Tax=Euplotes crassus TaxID=5936 RepID=A0AAD1XVB3_EUPCR|nr:unnamed protein product [Moneuplotes crassus]